MLSLLRKPLVLVRILRPQQWVKNLVVFSALIGVTNDQLLNEFVRGVMAFCIFCCAASFVYIFNDVLDFKHDQLNPNKSHRPIATGEVSSVEIAVVSGLLLGLLVYLLWLAGNIVTIPILVYICGNLIYSTVAKKAVYFDLLLIAIFFHLRVYTGAEIMQMSLSYTHYLFGFVCFLGLAALKRYIEISQYPRGVPGRAYQQSHLKVVSMIGLICTGAATVLLVRYLRGAEIMNVYRHPTFLMLLVPIFIVEAGLLTYKARGKKLSEDLTMLWRNDLASQVFFIAVLFILALSR